VCCRVEVAYRAMCDLHCSTRELPELANSSVTGGTQSAHVHTVPTFLAQRFRSHPPCETLLPVLQTW